MFVCDVCIYRERRRLHKPHVCNTKQTKINKEKTNITNPKAKLVPPLSQKRVSRPHEENPALSLLILQLIGEPVEAFVEPIAAGRTGGLYIPVAVTERVKAEFICDLSSVHSVWQILENKMDEIKRLCYGHWVVKLNCEAKAALSNFKHLLITRLPKN